MDLAAVTSTVDLPLRRQDHDKSLGEKLALIRRAVHSLLRRYLAGREGQETLEAVVILRRRLGACVRDQPEAQDLREALAYVLIADLTLFGERLRACKAARCRRLFVQSGRQRYCSGACRNRATFQRWYRQHKVLTIQAAVRHGKNPQPDEAVASAWAGQMTTKSARAVRRVSGESLFITGGTGRSNSQIPTSVPPRVPVTSQGRAGARPEHGTAGRGLGMDAIDSAILTNCLDDCRPLKPLLKTIPKGTLYRHAKRLTQVGWLVREGRGYRTTEAGRRHLQAARQGRQWNQFDALYRPIRLLPTEVHRAVFELSLAAVVCRQFRTRADRHPFFVCAGGTLRWKSSLGIVLCHALGLDPGGHLVECTAEVGKSLLVRRDAGGTIIYKRELLGTPLIILDEFQAATPAVRTAVAPLLSGRLVVPVENEQLTMSCVPLVLLNPVAKPTLEQRLGLSPPLIRRALIANLDAVVMPDLAVTGERALEAARAHPPLTVSPPAVDCQPFERRIIDLLREILNDAAADRIDLQVVVNLSTGMTAWLPDPTDAIAQVAYGVGLLAETMAWTRPGWIEAVTDFSLDPRTPRAVRHQQDEHAQAAAHSEPETIDLQVPKLRREPHLPDLSLSDELRGRLAWLAVETGRPVGEVINVLIDIYVKWKDQPETVVTLWKILQLARSLDRTDVGIDELHGYLAAEAALRKHQCRFEDVPEALRLIERLMALPQSWNWTTAEAAIEGMAFLIEGGVPASELRQFLARQQRLSQLEFEEKEAEAVAEALARAGAVGKQRTHVINRLVAIAGKAINAAELERERLRLETNVRALREEQAQLEVSIQQLKNQLATSQTDIETQ